VQWKNYTIFNILSFGSIIGFIVPVQIGFSLCFLGVLVCFFMVLVYLGKFRRGMDGLVPYLIILGMLLNAAGMLIKFNL